MAESPSALRITESPADHSLSLRRQVLQLAAVFYRELSAIAWRYGVVSGVSGHGV